MNQKDILNILSDININSETAGEAVELYIKFMYFEKVMDFIACLCAAGLIAAFVYFFIRLMKEESE